MENEKKLCPFLNCECLRKGCALWVDFDMIPAGNAACSFAHIASSMNIVADEGITVYGD